MRLFDQGRRIGARLELTRVNGQPGALAYDGEGLLLTVLALDVVDGRIQAIRSVANPDKLGHLGPISSYGRRDPVEWPTSHPTAHPQPDVTVTRPGW